MANREIITRSGKGSDLDATDHDQNHKSFAGTVEEQTGTTYEVVYTDQNKTIELNNASMVCTLDAIADVHSAIDTDNFEVTLKNTNSTDATVQRSSTDTVEGSTSITLAENEVITLQTDSTGGVWTIKSKGIVSSNTTLSGPSIASASFSGTQTGFAGDVTGDVTGDLTGKADTADALETARTIALSGDVGATGVAFDGSSNITINNTLIGASAVTENKINDDAVTFDKINSVQGTEGTISVSSLAADATLSGYVALFQTSGSTGDVVVQVYINSAWKTAVTLSTTEARLVWLSTTGFSTRIFNLHPSLPRNVKYRRVLG